MKKAVEKSRMKNEIDSCIEFASSLPCLFERHNLMGKILLHSISFKKEKKTSGQHLHHFPISPVLLLSSLLL